MSQPNQNWSIMRQVVIGAEDLDATSKELRDTLGLTSGFADPLLEDIGLADETIRVGPEAHLEIVAPLTDSASISGWITKGGGGGGYALSIQVPDATPLVANAEKAGVRIAADVEAYGRRIVQLHPGDMGLLVEFDEIPEPGQWFWDDIETETPSAPVVDDVLGVDVQSPDPTTQAEQWAAVFGVQAVVRDDIPRIALGDRYVNFVQGDRKMLSAIDLKIADGSEPTTHTISGVHLRLQ